MNSVKWTLCDRVVVLRHTKQAPTDVEWDAYVAAVSAHQRRHGDRMVVLVWTEGGGPTPGQRERARAALTAERGVRVAVVSASVAVRFIVSTMALFNDGIRTFGVGDLDGAMAHLSLSDRERDEVRRAVDALGHSLGAGA